MLTREILPDWALTLAYWTRRAFFLRRRAYRLVWQGAGWWRLDGDLGYPHRRVAINPALGFDWQLLEFKGTLGPRAPKVVWEMSLEPHPDGAALEVELPYGLLELLVRVTPLPTQGTTPRIELRELGLLDSKRFFDYRHWFRAFETPSAAARERLRVRARASELRVTVLLASSDKRPASDFDDQLPGKVQVCHRLDEATGDLVVPLEPGVVLAPHALASVVTSLLEDPEADVVYTDDDHIDDQGRHSDPSFKPAWSPELVRGRNLLRGLVAIRRSSLPPGVGGFLDEAGRYALVLACSEKTPSARIRRIPIVLASLGERRPAEAEAGAAVVAQHLERLGIQARVEPGLASGLRRIRYAIPTPAPRVSIIVPTRNAHRLVEMCVRSVRRVTKYPSYEIVLVDNGSDDPRSLTSFEALAKSGQVRLLRDPRPFNFSAINNDAVRQVSGELVCLLNNDVEAVDADWLEEMAALAMQQGVGAVGAKLLYPNRTVQHGGVLLGFYGAAHHAYLGVAGDSPGYDLQLLVRREVSALTAACLVVRRALYEEVGGLDAVRFPVGFNDVHFCLELRARGLRNIWTPYARLIHHESATRGRDVTGPQRARADAELAALRSIWGPELVEDPYHSPNLAPDSAVPRLAWPPRGRRPWWS